MSRLKNSFFLMIATAALILPCSANAQRAGMTVIRDTEIEDTVRDWVKPIFSAAGLDADGVNIVLIQSDDMNAFVAGGSNIFIFTGLIEKTDNPGELVGVIAHETGHIEGGHLIRTREAMERASYESILGAVLGVGAAVASGDAGAAPTVIMGANSMAQRRYLAHSRIQESSADQAALRFMKAAKMDPSGLVSFMKKLKSEIYMPSSQQSEYVLTHPLIENRIEFLERGVVASAEKGQGYPAAWSEAHKRIKAKLRGFINPSHVQWSYGDSDKSVSARYARAIAAYRQNKVDEALLGIDGLLAEEPQNPYFLELKAQMLVDFGRGAQAVDIYRKAIKIKPHSALLRIALGHALIESSGQGRDKSKLQEAIRELELSLDKEPRSSRTYRLLATAYGQLGDEQMAKVNLAEEALLKGRKDYAKEQAESVVATAKPGSKAALRAKDVITFVDSAEKR